MTDQHDDHLDALRAADRRPRPLADDVRRGIEDRMLAAYVEGRATATLDRDAELVVLELDRTEARPSRSIGSGRWLLAAAAAVLVVVLVLASGLGPSTGSEDVDLADAAADVDPDALAAVRAWCGDGLTDLRSALARADDDATRRTALDALAAAGDGLADLLAELHEPAIGRRLDEISRIPGEAAVLRDGPEAVAPSSLDDLVDRLQDELVLVSAGSPTCDVAR